ncbi:17879_t:CDS:2 [Funneliformis caledonium]|uniref:17879_t:CDS:1 n=1 Tax=Funneliformis caledonium TaxID=1117310 RepID=A0A9N9CYI4_9GLOM|nr:17879_t:CDS:2 [Funneliformis caledonium]
MSVIDDFLEEQQQFHADVDKLLALVDKINQIGINVLGRDTTNESPEDVLDSIQNEVNNQRVNDNKDDLIEIYKKFGILGDPKTKTLKQIGQDIDDTITNLIGKVKEMNEDNEPFFTNYENEISKELVIKKLELNGE